jgi:hypothetical protein
VDTQRIVNEEWWGAETYYSLDGNDITISYIPSGSTTVTIIFKAGVGENPTAAFIISTFNAILNKEAYFDASNSSDTDGEILHYIWDFGDGNQFSSDDKLARHSYTELGNYTVKLTVRDNDYLEDSISKTIFVVREGNDSDSDGVANEIDPNPYTNKDTDLDGLSDDYETEISKTDPLEKDTDGDGWDDNDEVEAGTSPTDSSSHPKEAGEESDNMVSIIIIVITIIIIIIALLIFILKGKKKAAEVEVIEEEPEIENFEEEPSPKRSRAPSRIKIQPPPIMKPVKERKKPVREPAKLKQKEMVDTIDMAVVKKLKPIKTKMPKKIPVSAPMPERKKTLIKLPAKKPPIKRSLVEKPSEDMPTTPPKPKIVPLKPRIVPLLEEESPAMFRENTIKEIMTELGLGRATAEMLFDGGFASVSQLKKASKRGLMTVKGVGPKLATKIIKIREKRK